MADEEKKGENTNGRDSRGRFLPDVVQPANRTGRPKKGAAWADIADELLSADYVKLTISGRDVDGMIKTSEINLTVKDQKSLRHAILTKQISLALSGDMAAIQDLKDREMGKPRQQVNLGFNAAEVQAKINLNAQNAPPPVESDLPEEENKDADADHGGNDSPQLSA